MAPVSGTFRSPPGHADGATAALGTVVARGAERAVAAPWPLHPSEIIEWLVEDGDPVSEGQPLVRVQQPKGGPGGWVPPESEEGA